jgi:Xaa-Pro aminopeptidase
MFAGSNKRHDFSVNVLRRRDLITTIKDQHPNKDGVVVLFADFESSSKAFKQESSFYYYTGISEPGLVIIADFSGNTTLYKPNCGETRSTWMHSEIDISQTNAPQIGINLVKNLGNVCAGYQFHPFFPKEEYEVLLDDLSRIIAAGKKVYTLAPNTSYGYVEQRLILRRIEDFLPEFKEHIVDISLYVARQRCTKDMREIESLFSAAEITILAQESAARAIQHDQFEREVQASLEYIFTAAGAMPAFPSIVGSGKNSTILHYTSNNSLLKNGDLVVVDIGAQYGQYCADITRTYPVSGSFTKRQREIYNIVLETQEYIASIAKPGYWLNNKQVPEKSLNHLARSYLAKKGYDQYFTHSIGHYLGLDVHDVGDYTRPLQEGDVFTIEPGIYISAENIGVRIEDDYWMVKDGVVCLTEQLVKKPEDIEALMRATDDDVYETSSFDDIDEDETTQA